MWHGEDVATVMFKKTPLESDTLFLLYMGAVHTRSPIGWIVKCQHLMLEVTLVKYVGMHTVCVYLHFKMAPKASFN
jgi:hypothetical protein